jgi:hypothetical protein
VRTPLAFVITLGTLACIGSFACGGSTPPPADAPLPSPSSQEGQASAPPSGAPAPSSESASGAPAASAAASPGGQTAPAAGVPSACADPSASVCTPARDYVDRLCSKPHQEIALALFAKDTPFTRLYLKGKLDELAFDEEVITLRFHAVAKNGIQVGSASGSYDVLRWDGTCAMAVDADMLSHMRPPKPRSARVLWHRIGDKTQTALIVASDAVKKAHAKRGKECRGAMTGDVSAACQKADATLVDAIVDYVRGGGTVPVPEAP